MYSINKEYTNTIIIKNSKFITVLLPFTNIDEFSNLIDNIKIKYPKATHYCYAYILGNVKKASDDKEPSNTAGRPILHVLEENNLNHVLCVVIRYFGGIKLGVGGLTRAYTKSVVEALKNITLQKLEKGNIIEITFPYDDSIKYENLFKDNIILDKIYQEKITFKVFIKENDLYKLNNLDYKTIQENIYK